MKNFINIIREAYDEFSIKGHADIKIRRNDPRFADNPLSYDDEVTELDEFDSTGIGGMGMLDRLHDLLQQAGVGDPEIKLGVQLSDTGMHKVAARLGIGPQEVTMLLAALTDKSRDEEGGSVAESYRRFIDDQETPDTAHPFHEAAEDDHYSAETDYLGDVTVRSAKKGKEKFYQGSQAAEITAKLKGVDDTEKDKLLEPLVEADTPGSFQNEINTDSGTYNFPWKLDGHTGFGTALYSTAGDQPQLKLISIRDGSGDDVKINARVHHELLAQARGFIGDA
jgi:hypothetical protein